MGETRNAGVKFCDMCLDRLKVGKKLWLNQTYYANFTLVGGSFMKRKPFFCITATAILYALLLIGCDALDSAMDTMSKNVYEEVGFVSADTSSADEVAGK